MREISLIAAPRKRLSREPPLLLVAFIEFNQGVNTDARIARAAEP